MSAETFVCSQLDLFTEGSVKKANQQERKDFAWSPTVRDEIMALFRSRINEWLHPSDFTPLATKYGIGHLIGHVVSRMHREGLIKSENHYYGSTYPWEKDYRGFKSIYMLEVTQCQTA